MISITTPRFGFPYALPFATWGGTAITATLENTNAGTINALGNGTQVIPQHVSVSDAGTLELTTAYDIYVFTGTTTTWTLPEVSGDTGAALLVYNRGSGDMTVERAGSDLIFDVTTVTSTMIGAGDWGLFVCDGTYWVRG